MNLSSCGINCDVCKYKSENGCPGCHEHKGNPFWGECDLYACAIKRICLTAVNVKNFHAAH